jgi:hypothetical protein
MGRPCLLDHPLTAAERAQRYRAKRREQREIVIGEDVLDRLKRDYGHAGLTEKDVIRKGVKKLMARWQKDAERYQRWWAKRFPK